MYTAHIALINKKSVGSMAQRVHRDRKLSLFMFYSKLKEQIKEGQVTDIALNGTFFSPPAKKVESECCFPRECCIYSVVFFDWFVHSGYYILHNIQWTIYNVE